MRQLITFLLMYFITFGLLAQTTATFESFDLTVDTFLNGSDGSGGFNDGNIFLPNAYFPGDFAFWTGWSISTKTDTLSAGFMNQYSAITGSGFEDSPTYAVTYVSPSSVIKLSDDAMGERVSGLYVTNGTYPYLSILNGDGFAKKFGGETGNDPDFFLLTIKKYLNGELSSESIDFYLADYRFEDNSQDYIVKDWTFVDLSSLGDVDSLQFSLTSSDVGQYGMNTPAYFCIDNITTLDTPTASRNFNPDLSISIFPNPTTDLITIRWEEEKRGVLRLFNSNGQVLNQQALRYGNTTVPLVDFPRGHYFLRLETENAWMSRTVIKH